MGLGNVGGKVDPISIRCSQCTVVWFGTEEFGLHALYQKSKLCVLVKLRSLVSNPYIHVPVSDLYISRIGLPIWLHKIGRPVLGIYKALTDT